MRRATLSEPLSFDELRALDDSMISRAVKWRDRNPGISRGAFERALELIDFTLDDPRHRRSEARLREIARVRELVVDFFDGPNEYQSTAEGLQKYFDAYALARTYK